MSRTKAPLVSFLGSLPRNLAMSSTQYRSPSPVRAETKARLLPSGLQRGVPSTSGSKVRRVCTLGSDGADVDVVVVDAAGAHVGVVLGAVMEDRAPLQLVLVALEDALVGVLVDADVLDLPLGALGRDLDHLLALGVEEPDLAVVADLPDEGHVVHQVGADLGMEELARDLRVVAGNHHHGLAGVGGRSAPGGFSSLAGPPAKAAAKAARHRSRLRFRLLRLFMANLFSHAFIGCSGS